MSHYDLYDTLGIPRSIPTPQVSDHIASLRARGDHQSSTQSHDLDIAQKILGNDRKRKLYDAQLNDPTADPITRSDLDDLAELTFPDEKADTEQESTSDSAKTPAPEPAKAESSHSETASSAGSDHTKSVSPHAEKFFTEDNPTSILPPVPPVSNLSGSSPIGKNSGSPASGNPQFGQNPFGGTNTGVDGSNAAGGTQWSQPQWQPQYAPANAAGDNFGDAGYGQLPGEAVSSGKKKSKALPIVSGVLVVLLVLGAGGWALWNFLLQPKWSTEDEAIKQAFPQIVPDRQNARGWNNLPCKEAKPENDQKAKILCGNDDLLVSLVEFDSTSARDQYLPTEGQQTLTNGSCSALSVELPGRKKPTYAVWIPTQGSFALLVYGNNAEQERLSLPIC